MYVHACGYLRRPGESGPHGAGVAGSCESPEAAAGTRLWSSEMPVWTLNC